MNSSEYGEITDDFQIQLLKDLCVLSGIQTGPFGSQLHQKDYLPVGTPIITVEHLGENRIIHQDLPRISDEDRDRLSRYIMRKGDIIFSRVGSVDRRALVRSEEDGWLFSGRCLRVRPDTNKIDPEFLSWFFGLESFKDYIRRIAVGATMPSLNTELLSNVPIILPPLPEQRAIADVLGALDDKIELNRRMNHTLEQMARALFKSWFVDFDPVRRNAERRMKNEECGMQNAEDALFPAAFEGDIPQGWRVGKLSDICKIIIGGDWGEDNQFHDSIQAACLRGVDLEKLRLDGFSDAPIRWFKKSSVEKRMMTENDVLIAASGIGPVGRPLWVSPELVTLYGKPVIYSNFCKRFTAITPAHAVYIDRLLFEMRQNDEIWEYVNGTSIPNLDSDSLLNQYEILIPPEKILNAYYEFVKPIYSKLYNQQSRTLAALRDALLPRLMSGEIRVKDEG